MLEAELERECAFLVRLMLACARPGEGLTELARDCVCDIGVIIDMHSTGSVALLNMGGRWLLIDILLTDRLLADEPRR